MKIMSINFKIYKNVIQVVYPGDALPWRTKRSVQHYKYLPPIKLKVMDAPLFLKLN